METRQKHIDRLRRGVEALRLRIPGLDDEDKRALRRCAIKEILFLERQRGQRISRGPRSRRKAGTCELSGWLGAEKRGGISARLVIGLWRGFSKAKG